MKRFVKSPAWFYRPMAQEDTGLLIPLVAHKADLSSVVQINPSAANIWECLSTPKTADEIIKSLRLTFEVSDFSEAQMSQDVGLALKNLLALGVIESLD